VIPNGSTIARRRELLSHHLQDGVGGRVEPVRVHVIMDDDDGVNVS